MSSTAKVQQFADLATRIARVPRPGGVATTIVAVDGCGAAGKSVFAQRLGAALNCPIAHTDDFASWDHPLDWHERAVDELFAPLAAGRRAVFRGTDWIHGGVGDFITVEVAPTVIVEGVTSSRRAFDRFLTFRIWIDASRDERLRRGIERDAAHWASPRDIRKQWLEWMRAEDDYVADERPDERADLVVDGSRVSRMILRRNMSRSVGSAALTSRQCRGNQRAKGTSETGERPDRPWLRAHSAIAIRSN